uniref:DUF2326 domain-containing protein n=1 Tax=Desulfovibrio sp. U5L TaxID=596152 RepID=I2PWL9_9BACT
MKLIHLDCDQPSFKTVKFNPNGLNLIVGDGSKNTKEMGSSNGVGKTLALRLVNHCLGANTNRLLKEVLPEWMFSLQFQIDDTVHQSIRSGDGKQIELDGVKLNKVKFLNWLDNCGAFHIDPTIPELSFRSLVKRFARYEVNDCADPLSTAKEPDYQAQLRSLYLLGVDCFLALSKKRNKEAFDNTKYSQTNWKDDEVLKRIFRAGAEPKVRAEWLESEILRLQDQRDNFKVAEDYREIELQANDLTSTLRKIEKDIAVLNFHLSGIEKSLREEPDISRDKLLELYEGLQFIFKPEALQHFSNVELFHSSLFENRKSRLAAEKLRLKEEIDNIASRQASIAKTRDALLQSLHGKRALDDYASLVNRLAELKEEHKRLVEYLSMSENLQERLQEIKEKMVEENRLTNEYVQTNPVSRVNSYFKYFVNYLYPESPAGIVLDNNAGDNRIRYRLNVHIEGQESDGINDARIICFDLLVLLYGANHSMGFVWHDNRFFADIDPRQRAAWFRLILQIIPKSGKQYIASINTENFTAMKEFLSHEEWDQLQDAVRLRLSGDNPANKLMGIQFGA